jgi:hypothetical protein
MVAFPSPLRSPNQAQVGCQNAGSGSGSSFKQFGEGADRAVEWKWKKVAQVCQYEIRYKMNLIAHSTVSPPKSARSRARVQGVRDFV